jgi:hypothetical protein
MGKKARVFSAQRTQNVFWEKTDREDIVSDCINNALRENRYGRKIENQ